MSDDLDDELVDQERDAELARMAEAKIARLDSERFAEIEDAEASINRQLADLERETES